MTTRLKLKLVSSPELRVKVVPNIASDVVGVGGISVTRSGNAFTVAPDFAALPLVGTLDNPEDKQFWAYDPVTQDYWRAPIQAIVDLTEVYSDAAAASAVTAQAAAQAAIDAAAENALPQLPASKEGVQLGQVFETGMTTADITAVRNAASYRVIWGGRAPIGVTYAGIINSVYFPGNRDPDPDHDVVLISTTDLTTTPIWTGAQASAIAWWSARPEWITWRTVTSPFETAYEFDVNPSSRIVPIDTRNPSVREYLHEFGMAALSDGFSALARDNITPVNLAGAGQKRGINADGTGGTMTTIYDTDILNSTYIADQLAYYADALSRAHADGVLSFGNITRTYDETGVDPGALNTRVGRNTLVAAADQFDLVLVERGGAQAGAMDAAASKYTDLEWMLRFQNNRALANRARKGYMIVDWITPINPYQYFSGDGSTRNFTITAFTIVSQARIRVYVGTGIQPNADAGDVNSYVNLTPVSVTWIGGSSSQEFQFSIPDTPGSASDNIFVIEDNQTPIDNAIAATSNTNTLAAQIVGQWQAEISPGVRDPRQAILEWALANYLLVRGEYTYWAPCPVDPTLTSAVYGCFWDIGMAAVQIGYYLNDPYRIEHLWLRDYSNGLVVVNPTSDTDQVLQLPVGFEYTDQQGVQRATSMTVPAATAYVLVVTNP